MYNNILAEIARKGLKRCDVAKKIGITEATLRAKIQGKQDFKQNEINALLSLFGTTYEYLFLCQG